MIYRNGTRLSLEDANQEIDLLQQGRTYKEIAAMLDRPARSIEGRNRRAYGVDTFQAYADRIAREGIPDRLCVDDAFGHWFTGFFDGDGTFCFFFYPPKLSAGRRKTRCQVGTSIQVVQRHDSRAALEHIQSSLGIGYITHRKAYKRDRPYCVWAISKLKDLAEIMIPLFDRYPLYTKKAREYQLWRQGIVHRYSWTLGGMAHGGHALTEADMEFYQGIHNAIREIRHCETTPIVY